MTDKPLLLLTPSWNVRNRCLGLEETCSFFAEGLGPSIEPNVISQAGFPTAVGLTSYEHVSVNFIEGCIRIRNGFESIASVEFGDQEVCFISTGDREAVVDVNYEFLRNGELPGCP